MVRPPIPALRGLSIPVGWLWPEYLCQNAIGDHRVAAGRRTGPAQAQSDAPSVGPDSVPDSVGSCSGPSQGRQAVLTESTIVAGDTPGPSSTASQPSPGSEFTVITSKPKKRKAVETPLPDNSESLDAPSRPSCPPPLFVYGVKNVVDLSRRLRLGVRLSADAQMSLRVCCATDEEYRAVCLFLQANGLQFHTFTNEKAAHVRLIMRGLGEDSDPDEVTDELRQLGFPIKECIRLYTAHEPKRKLPLLLVIIIKGELADRLLGLTSLCGLRIKVERSREAGHVPQCHRCQRFSHGSDSCHNEVACVSCGNPHPTKSCMVPALGHRYCINCGEPHSANYRGCWVFQDQLKQAADRNNPSARQQRQFVPEHAAFTRLPEKVSSSQQEPPARPRPRAKPRASPNFAPTEHATESSSQDIQPVPMDEEPVPEVDEPVPSPQGSLHPQT